MVVPAATRLRALEEFARCLSLPGSELMGQAVDKARLGTGVEAAELFLVEEHSGQSLLVCHRGLFPEAFHQLTRFSPGQGYPGLVASRREAISTDNLPGDERYLRTQVKELGFRAYFCLPLHGEDRVLGCLNIATRRPQGITGDDRQFLEGLGGGLSFALEAGRWRLADVLAHLEGEVGDTPEKIAGAALEAVAELCRGSGAALLFVPAPGATPFLSTWGTWRADQVGPQGGLPQGAVLSLPKGCTARLSPRLSLCPEPDCPFTALRQALPDQGPRAFGRTEYWSPLRTKRRSPQGGQGGQGGQDTAGTSVCYPLWWRGEALGVLSLRYGEGPPAFGLLPGVTALLATVLGRMRYYCLAQEQAIEAERQRLAREIHDGVIQSLGLLRVKAEYLRRLAEREPERLAEELEGLRHLAGDAVDELRRTIHSLPPVGLEREGLASSLYSLAQRLGQAYRLPVVVRAQGTEATVSPSLQLHLLRFAQEALSNALRHSAARQVEVELMLDHSGCRLVVRDDGHGFEPEGARGGMGLLTMQARARSLGGTLLIDSAPGRGTALQVWLPRSGG